MIARGQDHGVHSQQTTITTHLDLENCRCLHTNVITVVFCEDQLEFYEPSVLSSLTEQAEARVTRRTEVRYLRKKYIIQDVYQFDYSPGKESSVDLPFSSIQSFESKQRSDELSSFKENQKKPSKPKKFYIFRKQMKSGKRNTKNLPKNFFKGFLGYVQARSKTQNLEELMKILHNLGKGAKYNNILLQKLLSNSRIAPYFKDFLENFAERWICESKITDKEMHLEAVPIYLSLFNKYNFAEGDMNSQSYS